MAPAPDRPQLVDRASRAALSPALDARLRAAHEHVRVDRRQLLGGVEVAAGPFRPAQHTRLRAGHRLRPSQRTLQRPALVADDQVAVAVDLQHRHHRGRAAVVRVGVRPAREAHDRGQPRDGLARQPVGHEPAVRVPDRKHLVEGRVRSRLLDEPAQVAHVVHAGVEHVAALGRPVPEVLALGVLRAVRQDQPEPQLVHVRRELEVGVRLLTAAAIPVQQQHERAWLGAVGVPRDQQRCRTLSLANRDRWGAVRVLPGPGALLRFLLRLSFVRGLRGCRFRRRRCGSG